MQLLFVEDDALIREVVSEYLHDHGFDVVEAATAEDAMLRVVDTPVPPLVVTDIDLGAGRSGIELADALRERWPEVAVIFVTGRLDRLDGRCSSPREAALGKPFRLPQLVAIAQNFLPAKASSPL
jgi:DNA-binding response OmpR family regulator